VNGCRGYCRRHRLVKIYEWCRFSRTSRHTALETWGRMPRTSDPISLTKPRPTYRSTIRRAPWTPSCWVNHLVDSALSAVRPGHLITTDPACDSITFGKHASLHTRAPGHGPGQEPKHHSRRGPPHPGQLPGKGPQDHKLGTASPALHPRTGDPRLSGSLLAQPRPNRDSSSPRDDLHTVCPGETPAIPDD
jgi:hypothetical protein